MKKLAITLAIAGTLVVAAPAEAHQFKVWYGNGAHVGLKNPGAYVDDQEAMGTVMVALKRVEGIYPTYMRAHDRINATATWVQHSRNSLMHSCLADWDVGGPEPGWTVTCYPGWRP